MTRLHAFGSLLLALVCTYKLLLSSITGSLTMEIGVQMETETVKALPNEDWPVALKAGWLDAAALKVAMLHEELHATTAAR